MGWGQAIAQGLGRSGAELGTAEDAQIKTALDAIQGKLMQQEVQGRLREQDMRMKQMQTPQASYMPTPGGGTDVVMQDPFSKAPIGKPQQLIPGQNVPKTLDQAWIDATTAEQGGKPPSAKQINEHYDAQKGDPIKQLERATIDALAVGDKERAGTLIGMMKTLSGAKSSAQPSVMSLVMKANAGDKEAQAALDTKMKMDKELAGAKGAAYGAGRAMYMIQAYMDPDSGQMVPMSNMDALAAIHAGKSLIPSGRLPANLAMSVQQLVSEATPALHEVRRHLSAFDNASDRAIFARVLANNPAAAAGQEQQWLGTVLNQALTGHLSEDGRLMVVRLNRLNESVGRLRAVLGLPATERMVAMTLAMVPGPATPDSRMAGDIMDNLESTITNAVQVPMLGGLGKQRGNGGASTPPPGATIKTFNPATRQVE